jgi:hypothetical protein
MPKKRLTKPKDINCNANTGPIQIPDIAHGKIQQSENNTARRSNGCSTLYISHLIKINNLIG